MQYTITSTDNELITINIVHVDGNQYTAELSNGDEWVGHQSTTKEQIVDDIEALWGRNKKWQLTYVGE